MHFLVVIKVQVPHHLEKKTKRIKYKCVIPFTDFLRKVRKKKVK